tara:strand:- start:4376 stop:5020 length:645 start_codon:yes stop_codon:yes gene_type:complete
MGHGFINFRIEGDRLMAFNHERGLCWYNDTYKLCFIGVPKNAQTSIRNAFNLNSNQTNYNILSSDRKKYTTICVIRNPFYRIISGYLEVLNRSNSKTKTKSFYAMSESKDRFIKFLDEVEREKWDAHVEPQTFYISDINFDRILIFENIQEDIKSLCQDLNMSINFPHLNKKSNLDKSRVYQYFNGDINLQKKIRKIYEEDFKLYEKISGEIKI